MPDNINVVFDPASAVTKVQTSGFTYTGGRHYSGTDVPMSDQAYSLLTANNTPLATDRDVYGKGHYGFRGWLHRNGKYVAIATVAIIGGVGAAAGAGGGAAGAAGEGAAAGGAGAGAGSGASVGIAGAAEGAVGSSGAVSGVGAGVGGATASGTAASTGGGFLASTANYARYAQIGLDLASTAEQIGAANLNAKAAQYQEEVVGRQQAVERRDLVRQIYIARAESIAASAASSTGALESSAPLGANSSILSQGTFALNYFDAQAESERLYRKYLVKGQKKSNTAGLIKVGAQIIGDIYS